MTGFRSQFLKENRRPTIWKNSVKKKLEDILQMTFNITIRFCNFVTLKIRQK